ncbi:MAG: hypothetical protein ACYDEN_02060 [Acidimicrobiales bacterium]
MVVEDRWSRCRGLKQPCAWLGSGRLPEDVGGPPGHADLRRVLADPGDQEHEHLWALPPRQARTPTTRRGPPWRRATVAAAHLGVAVTGSLLLRPYTSVIVESTSIVNGCHLVPPLRPCPAPQPGGHGVELAAMRPGEAAQEGAQRGGGGHPLAHRHLRASRAPHVSVVDVVASRQRLGMPSPSGAPPPRRQQEAGAP